MNSYEMRRALETAGLKLNCQLHQIIVARFADEDLVIDFDNFVCCLIRLKTLFMAVFYCHLSHWHQPETSTRA
ncbi:calpain-2 catalytic subunit-like [Taeniopygia guttata]|uniref:calpain-2 catalytic subunit-like n=1 Tax=Taeniopygia guttata TaxID=59729 RepID=UPI003BB978D7